MLNSKKRGLIIVDPKKKLFIIWIGVIGLLMIIELYFSKIFLIIIGSLTFFSGSYTAMKLYNHYFVVKGNLDPDDTIGVDYSNEPKDPDSPINEGSEGSPFQKETILADISIKIDLSKEIKLWMSDKDSVLDENEILESNSKVWNDMLVNLLQKYMNELFLEFGFPEANLPAVKIYKATPGSWDIGAYLVILGPLGSAYLIFKEILKDCKDIHDSYKILNDFKAKLHNKFNDFKIKFSRDVDQELTRQLEIKVGHKPDEEKLSEITAILELYEFESNLADPSTMRSHIINLDVAISRNDVALRNLGDNVVTITKLSLFANNEKMYRWHYDESYMSYLTPKEGFLLPQSRHMSKKIKQFFNNRGISLDISDNMPIYVDCWAEDKYGIYLSKFYLNRFSYFNLVEMKTINQIRLSVRISEKSIYIKNLNKIDMNNVKLGIFKSKSERHIWRYVDSYMKDIETISPLDEIEIYFNKFKNKDDLSLDTNDIPLYFDCWVQEDPNGIYLFRFYLDETEWPSFHAVT